jgi:hypothetical protein
MPNMVHGGVYSATLRYLKAVKAAETKRADAVAKRSGQSMTASRLFEAARDCRARPPRAAACCPFVAAEEDLQEQVSPLFSEPTTEQNSKAGGRRRLSVCGCR